MPIDIETFEQNSEFDNGQTNAERILRFLARNNDRAFERNEIAEATGMNPNTVSAVLSRLKERGFVRHKPPYWAIADDTERLERYSGYERATALFNDRLGEEDKELWREHASDEPHPNQENEQ
ncbi:helix-turn-helix domain-containing protein [Halolamina sp.]|jgi:DNA-binding transcriptional ArsR family regulator|uniref:helix-turn-helix transcriptional regulator n=1 Tax=Halolamina sp. TaxID=1940283 RepID=UPI000223B736|nr:sugar-specific transcriptional regulator TrmB [halophilic archaeon DL31]